MKRGGFLKRRTRLRPKRTKPGVTGRPSLDRQAWNLLKQALWLRAKGRCEVPWCRKTEVERRLDPHHVVKRSQGGADELKNLTLLCAVHHEETDAPYQDGRLVVTMFRGIPLFQTLFAPDKFTVRSASVSTTGNSGAATSAGARSRRRPDQHPVVIPRREDLYPTVPQRRGR